MKSHMVWLGVLAAGFGLAAEIVVENTPDVVYVKGDGGIADASFTVSTVHQEAFPTEVGTPIFWFDASDTNGWTFAEGTKNVLAIPSKVGDGRFLTADLTGGNLAGFESWMNKKGYPTLEPQAEFGGLPAVDFGASGSDRGLVFNPIANEQTGNVASNILLNIGTVIAVYGSQAGGGYFLSGGFGPIDNGWFNGGFWWMRADKSFLSTRMGYVPMNPVGRGSTPEMFNKGSLYIDGLPYSLQDKGFGGCWEVVDVTPTENGMQASGLGFNDARRENLGVNMTGGMKIAELLVFGTCLSAEARVKVQRWLDRKWFGRTVGGVNGCGDLGTVYGYRADWNAVGFPITVNVPAGEELALSRNLHGRGGVFDGTVDSVTNLSSYVKTGAGTFALKDAENFQGVVRLREGTLRLPQRPVPAAIPAGAFLHFDVSGDNVASAVTTEEGGVEYVDVWRNLNTAATYYDEPICARPPAAENRPVLLRDELGAGLNVLDFGPVVNSTTLSGRHLLFATNETDAVTKKVKVPQCITVLAVVGAQHGGGHVVGSAESEDKWLRRGEQQPTAHTQSLLAHEIAGHLVLVDGVPCTKTATCGYVTPGYQVLAMRQPKVDTSASSTLSSIATGLAKSSGGCRIGELAIYLRALSDDEMRDASAALMRKWLGRTAPGYATPAAQTVPHLQNLMTEGDGTAALDVPAGETVTVGTVSGRANLVKTGAGTLRIVRNVLQGGAVVVCREGSVLYADSPDVATACELAAAPSLHLRADGKKELLDGKAEGEKVVALWYGENNRNAAWRSMTAPALANMPTYLADGCNGKPALDFGILGNTRGGRDLALAQPLNNVRAAYLLVKYHAQPEGVTGNYPMPLGSLGSGSSRSLAETKGVICDFLRQYDYVISSNPGAACARMGEIRIDGTPVASTQAPTKETWQLVEFHTKGGSHVSALGTDRSDGGSSGSGGFALAEVVLYERPLSAREKVATRNYLMKKWLGTADEDLEALPPTEADVVAELSVDGTMGLNKASSTAVARLTGEGVFVKDGAGTLTLDDWSGFAGTVDVVDGTVAVVKASPIGEMPPLVTQGLILQMDASQGVAATTNASGVAEVTEWKSALNDGWRAVPLTAGKYPTLVVSDELNGGCTVDMATSARQGFRFQKDGVGAEITTAKSIFWVIGSQNGGGFLMGGGHRPTSTVNPHLAWHRGGAAGCGAENAGNVLLNTSHCEVLLTTSSWRKNGSGVSPGAVGLSGSWDLLDVVVPADAAYGLQAEGFAFDGRYLDGGSMADRVGSQRLAEVLVYDRRLTDAEVAAVEDYLRRKWHFRVQGGSTDGVDVNVGAAATLDLGGYVQSVGAFTGAGAVLNGTLRPSALVADYAATAWPTIASLEVREGLVVDVRSVPAGLSGKAEIKIADVGEVAGFEENAGSIVLLGDVPGGLSCKVKYEAGVLKAVLRAKGLSVIFR